MGRPTTPMISRRAVVEAALRIIDEEGAEALSMRRLARELNVTGPSFYYHYSDKSEILDDVTRVVMSDTPLPDSTQADWRAWVVESGRSYGSALRAHPNVLPLLLENYPRQSREVVFDYLSGHLQAEGVPQSEVGTVIRLVESFELGVMLLSGNGPSATPDPESARAAEVLFELLEDLVEVVVDWAKKQPDAPPPKRARKPR